MGLYDYSKRVADEREVARAQAYDLDASYKDLGEVFRSIKGKSIEKAAKILEDCISMDKAIPFARHNTNLGHRKELNGKKGKYPRKESRIALKLLRGAEANANYKGLETPQLIVAQAAAYKQNVLRRYRKHITGSVVLGYGKQTLWSNYVTCRAELVLAKGRLGRKKVEKRGD